MRSVAIVGTGLIGASFGLALRRAGFQGSITGVSGAPALAEAVRIGAVDRSAPLAEAVAGSDLIFLSQTIGRILDSIRKLDPLVRPGALVTDAGSTKLAISDLALQCLSRCQFLGGHPMAGKEQRGAAAADAALFEGCTWVLTPSERADLETGPVSEFVAWIRRIGAHPVIMNAEEHDAVVCYTSHLSQLASTALAATIADCVPNTSLRVAGSGLPLLWRRTRSSTLSHRERVRVRGYSLSVMLVTPSPQPSPQMGRGSTLRLLRRCGPALTNNERAHGMNSE